MKNFKSRPWIFVLGIVVANSMIIPITAALWTLLPFVAIILCAILELIATLTFYNEFIHPFNPPTIARANKG
ncbi:MAG: hypothetical protein PHE24_03690 [Patescibacteria group bacterium]|nr:hypothetical protein [Patescibacteria group bacterium]